MRYVAAIGQGAGIVEKFTDSDNEIEAFARAHDRAPFGVYDCVSRLKPLGRRYARRMPNLESISLIHIDIDLKDLAAAPGEVRSRLDALPPPFELRDSGGGFHVLVNLKTAATAGTLEVDRVAELRKQMTTTLSGDRAPCHHVALLRRPGTTNFKYDPPRPCRILRPGAPVDLDEAGSLIDALGVNPYFGRGAIEPRLNPRRIPRQGVEDDPYALLSRMGYRGAYPTNATQLAATRLLLVDGLTVLNATQLVLRATRDAVRGQCADWDWRKEEEQIASMCYRYIDKHPNLSAALPDHLYSKWHYFEAAGKRPQLILTRNIGWVVEAAEELAPPTLSELERFLKRATADAGLTVVALRYANSVFLDTSLRTKGYIQMSAECTGDSLGMSPRSVERARSLLLSRGHLKRVPGGNRAARLALSCSD
jgi:hypothetical protein